MDILGKNITNLMPTVYAKYHDVFLENYLQSLEQLVLNFEKEVPLINKLGYIIMIRLSVRYIPSIIQGLQFVGRTRRSKSFLSLCYFILNKECDIEYCTSSCLNLLKMEQKKIALK
jgi:hypothetical protein